MIKDTSEFIVRPSVRPSMSSFCKWKWAAVAVAAAGQTDGVTRGQTDGHPHNGRARERCRLTLESAAWRPPNGPTALQG